MPNITRAKNSLFRAQSPSLLYVSISKPAKSPCIILFNREAKPAKQELVETFVTDEHFLQRQYLLPAN